MFDIVVEKIETGPNTWAKSKAYFRLNGTEIISFERNYPSYPHVVIEDEEAYYVYHSPDTYMKWAVTRVLKSNSCTWTQYFGWLSWAQLYPNSEGAKERTKPVLCFAAFKTTPDQKHLFISGCDWGGPYIDVCLNIEHWNYPKLINIHSGYINDNLDYETINDNIEEVHNDYILFETEPRDDESRPLWKMSVAHRDKDRPFSPYVLTEYGQIVTRFKWFFLTNTYEHIEELVALDPERIEYEKENWRRSIWPLDMSYEEIVEKDREWTLACTE